MNYPAAERRGIYPLQIDWETIPVDLEGEDLEDEDLEDKDQDI